MALFNFAKPELLAFGILGEFKFILLALFFIYTSSPDLSYNSSYLCKYILIYFLVFSLLMQVTLSPSWCTLPLCKFRFCFTLFFFSGFCFSIHLIEICDDADQHFIGLSRKNQPKGSTRSHT